MPTVKWETAGARKSLVPIVTPSKTTAFCLLAEVFETFVHYVEGDAGSRPCFSLPECAWCQRGMMPRRYGYAAALQYDVGRCEWRLVAVGICKTFLNDIHEIPNYIGQPLIFEVVKEFPKRDQRRVRKPTRELAPIPQVQPFDICERMLQHWGLNRREEVLVSEPDTEIAETIPFRRQTAS